MGSGEQRRNGRQHELRVLVVDDSPIIRERLSELIRSIPETEVIGAASNAREALEMMQTLEPDLVTLDLHMSGGNGFEFLSRIQHIAPPQPQVIVLTNYSDEQYRRRCLASGAVAFLDKSRQFDELTRLIPELGRLPRELQADARGGVQE